MVKIEEGFTFDDVLLIPTISICSRKETNTEANLTPSISLSISIVSANMDTVTGSYMAITMASLGELRECHNKLRNNRIEKGLHR